MAIYRLTKAELKQSNANKYKDGDIVEVTDKTGETIYMINIHYGEYKSPLKTYVTNRDYKMLGCTPGTPNGWPYYIADFIYSPI